MKGFDKSYNIKSDPKTVKKWYKPSIYLCADLAKFQVPDIGEKWWSMSRDSYSREAIKTVKDKIVKSNQKLYKNTT